MSIIGSNVLAGASGQAAAAGGYQVERSLRFNSSDSAFCSRTPAVAGNRKTWTWAGWVKRANFSGGTGPGDHLELFGAYAGTYDNSGYLDVSWITGTGQLYVGFLYFGIFTTAVFRDVSAWYHIVIAVDTTQATLNNRVKAYVNGVDQGLSVNAGVTLGLDTAINHTGSHTIGRNGASGFYYLSGYLADIHFIDGLQLDPSSFTEVSATTGQLVPIEYTGSYGTNGFHLDFSDNSAATAATLGADTSGNGNNWTPNNLSVTAGSGNDSLVDTPTSIPATDTGVGGEIRGNYATLNPLDNGGLTISNGNLDYVRPSNGYTAARATIGVTSGKWYWEQTIVGTPNAGIFAGISTGGVLPTYPGQTATSYGYSYDGDKYTNNTNSVYGASYTTGDVLGVAFDADNGTLTFYKNGSSQGTAFSGLTSGPYFPTFSAYLSSAGSNVNFGQRAFAYPLSGFKALCDTNLDPPLVALPNTVMDVALWSGNGGSQTITLPGAFSPDFVWIKRRSSTFSSLLYDTVRGNGPNTGLISDSTTAEGGASDNATYGYLNAFNSTGFALTAGSSSGYVNTSGQTYVGWAWDAGSTPVAKVYGAAATASSTAPLATTFISNASPSTVPNSYQNYDLDLGRSVTTIDIKFTYTANTISYLVSTDGTNWTSLSTGNSQTAGATVTINHTSAFRYLRFHYPPGNFNQGFQEINNTAGSITSQVRANASAGFSVVTYTGNGTSGATIGHGLGVKPGFVIIKSRSGSGASYYWICYHSSLGATQALELNSTTGAFSAPGAWNNTEPTSSVISVAGNAVNNGSGSTYVAYCFAPVAGYSSAFTWSGTGSTDGPAIYLGFRPKLIIWKRTDSGANWAILDSSRSSYNVADDWLGPNSSSAESADNAAYAMDFLSNGLKIRATHEATNQSGGTYIGFAFAESPFQYARAR